MGRRHDVQQELAASVAGREGNGVLNEKVFSESEGKGRPIKLQCAVAALTAQQPLTLIGLRAAWAQPSCQDTMLGRILRELAYVALSRWSLDTYPES